MATHSPQNIQPEEHIELTTPERKRTGLFSKLMGVLGSMGSRIKKTDILSSEISRFDEFVKAVDPKDPIYNTVKKVASLCDEAIKLSREKLMLDSKLQVVSSELQEIAYYDNLSEEDIEHLKEMVARYMGLSKDRNGMRYQIASFDKAIEKMDNLEDDAKYILENVRDAEKKQRYFKNDLRHIEGEKTALIYERENLLNAQVFVEKLSLVLMIVFLLAGMGILGFAVATRGDFFVPMMILVVMVLAVVPALNYVKNRIARELKLNLRKQKRASELFNKKSVVYVHYTKFLNFVYKKYQVSNAEKLDQNIRDYDHYRHILTRYDAIGKSMRDTEDSIDFFIREKGIKHSAATIEAFAKTMDIEDKKRYYLELKKEHERLSARNTQLEHSYNTIWNDLIELNDADKKSQIIDFMIQRYIEEVGKLTTTTRHEEVKLEESPFADESQDVNGRPTLKTPSSVKKASKSLGMDTER